MKANFWVSTRLYNKLICDVMRSMMNTCSKRWILDKECTNAYSNENQYFEEPKSKKWYNTKPPISQLKPIDTCLAVNNF